MSEPDCLFRQPRVRGTSEEEEAVWRILGERITVSQLRLQGENLKKGNILKHGSLKCGPF